MINARLIDHETGKTAHTGGGFDFNCHFNFRGKLATSLYFLPLLFFLFFLGYFGGVEGERWWGGWRGLLNLFTCWFSAVLFSDL